MKKIEKISAKKIKKAERNKIGCKALIGESVTNIAEEYSTNREFVYSQKKRVEEILKKENKHNNTPIIILDKKMIEKIIVGCMLVCKASTEDVQRFMNWIFMTWVSIGKISNTINKAALKAGDWNKSIDLSKIKIGANDEIFQGHSPVLVGVDPITTFTYLLKGEDHRDSTTWGYHFLEKEKHQNLKLDISVNDGGKGLRKGVKEAYPSADLQLDVFHTEYDLSKAVLSSEREAYKNINAEEKHKKRSIKKATSENIEKYTNSIKKSEESIHKYDILNILYLWIIELLSVGGYFYNERVELFDFIIKQIEMIPKKNIYLEKALKFIKDNLEEILQFVKRAEELMLKLAIDEKIPIESIRKMWEQLRYTNDSAEYNYLEGEIGMLLGKRYDEIREKWRLLMMKDIVRASSLVECINSLIRPYLFLKKVVPDKFLDLLQFYFNTRKYRRSHKPERVGKSPIELLTGKEYKNPIELLGY